MKLRNKKTGEILELCCHRSGDYREKYDSLAELNEEWEDYEEPKKHYFTIDGDGVLVCRTSGDFLNEGLCKEIGNYFETREEAEQAVEKLKAWKRLKDKGFRITIQGCKGNAWLQANWGNLQGDYSDVLFLFGGEE